MYKVTWQKDYGIEILLKDELNGTEFGDIIHQLESLASMYPEINILLDASELHHHDIETIEEEKGFFDEYGKKIKRIAVVADAKFPVLVLDRFRGMDNAEFRTFTNDQIEDARKWAFPSPLR